MPATIVQKNTGSVDSGSTFNVTLPSGTTAGNTLLIGTSGDFTHSTPAGFTLDRSQVSSNSHYLFRKAITGSETSWTITPSGSGPASWWVAEIDGITGLVDQVNSTGSSTAASTRSTGTTGTTTSADEFLVATFATWHGSTSSTVDSYTSSFTEQDESINTGAGTKVGIAWATRSVSATGTYESTATFSASRESTGIIATYPIGEPPAFPTLTAQNPTADSSTGGAATSGTTAAASHSVVLPATVNAGDLLLVFGVSAGGGTITINGGGWTIAQATAGAADDTVFWAYRNTLADGTEDGTSITVNHASSRMVAHTMAIGGAEDPATQAPQASTVATGTSTTPNPTAATPTGGAKDYLWVWFGGWEGEQTLSKTAPANYTDGPDVSCGTAGGVTANCQLKTARRELHASSEDPGSVTISVSDDWAAWVIAVHPASPQVTDRNQRGVRVLRQSLHRASVI